jgi:hypothetical protein
MARKIFCKIKDMEYFTFLRCSTLKKITNEERKYYVVPPEMSGSISDLANTAL